MAWIVVVNSFFPLSFPLRDCATVCLSTVLLVRYFQGFALPNGAACKDASECSAFSMCLVWKFKFTRSCQSLPKQLPAFCPCSEWSVVPSQMRKVGMAPEMELEPFHREETKLGPHLTPSTQLQVALGLKCRKQRRRKVITNIFLTWVGKGFLRHQRHKS